MGRYKEAPIGYECPYRHKCPHMEMSALHAYAMIYALDRDERQRGRN